MLSPSRVSRLGHHLLDESLRAMLAKLFKRIFLGVETETLEFVSVVPGVGRLHRVNTTLTLGTETAAFPA